MKAPVGVETRKKLTVVRVISIYQGKALIGATIREVILKQNGKVMVPVKMGKQDAKN